MKAFFINILLLSLSLYCSGHTTVAGNFDLLVLTEKGDLNKDSIPDLVIVSQDTLDEHAPYLLQVYFLTKEGKAILITETDKALLPDLPNGRDGFRSGNGFSDISIKSGILTINHELLRGNFSHKFRYQNGNIELIGYSSADSDGIGTAYYIDFNLSTGVRIEKITKYDTDQIIKNTKEIVKIRPLPKLQDFAPYANKLY